jgi:serine/threonine-protein kinase
MGEVYRARDTVLQRDVAVKILPAELAADADRRARFEREALAVARLSHPNILAIFDFGRVDALAFAVTELLDGETLRELIARGPVAWSRTADIVADIADGLAAAHAAGVVHRDVKPANVFITTDGRVKVLDFGLALVTTPDDSDGDTLTETRTTPGTIVGTIAYMSPEQLRGERVDGRSDIFSLGCVLHELITGRRPFAGPSAADVMAAILHGRRTPLAAQDSPTVPAPLARVIDHCLEPAAARRIQSAADLASALRALTDERRSAASTTSIRVHPEARPSIAVLPFVNLSADPEQEYFCDGMAEEIINALAHIDGIHVVARTSAFSFKGRQTDIRDIGEQLGVSKVLEGSVRKAGGRLRITAQLIDVESGFHLWSERFDRRLEDVFDVQDEIALAVVDNLRVRLLAGERDAVRRQRRVDLDAYNLYLKGLYYWSLLSPEGYARSRQCYEEAIALDPEFAGAYAQLAIWYGSQTFWGTIEPKESTERAMPLLEKALALDPTNAEAHSFMGIQLAFVERDWPSGERNLRRAVELSPNTATAWMTLAVFLLVRGDLAESISACRTAQRLDPLSPTLMAWTAAWLALAGETREARAALERQKAMYPAHWLPRHYLAEVLAREGRLSEAGAELDAAMDMSDGAPITLSLSTCLRLQLEDRAGAEAAAARLRERAAHSYVPPMFLAWSSLALGDSDAAVAHARRALDGHDPWVGFHRGIVPAFVAPHADMEALLEPVLP